jgi:Spy/CpxP family protein refolding chaperone
MLRKLTLALVAAASLSAVALAPSAASAHFGGGFHGFHHGFGGFGVGYVGGGYDDSGCYVTRLTPFGYRLRTFNVCG